MEFTKHYYVALLVCVSILFASAASAQSGYNTPDSWGRHEAVNSTKFTMDGMVAGTGMFKLGLTSRYTGRVSGSSDHDFYQYLRGYLSNFELGGGTLRAALNLRAAKDLDGVVTKTPGKYYFAPTPFDAKADYDSGYWDWRLYDANVVLDNVLRYTKFTAGRFRVNYLTEYRIDGAELLIGSENYNVYAYYGLPVSYYKYLNTTAYGGGINLHFLNDMIILRAELAHFSGGGKDLLTDPDNGTYNPLSPNRNVLTKTPESVDTTTWKVRLDLNFGLGGAGAAAPYGEVGMLQDAMIYEAGIYGNLAFTGTVLNLWTRGQIDNNSDPLNHAVSDYSYLMDSGTEYTQFGVNIFQGIMEFLAVGAGFEFLVNSKERYAYRDYIRAMGNIDLFGIIPNNYLSLTVDYYDVQANGLLPAENGLVFGGRMTQNITPAAAVWIGAKRQTYQYDYSPVGYAQLTQFSSLINRTEDKSVYIVYFGGVWHIGSAVSVLADYTYEMSDLLSSTDSDNKDIHHLQLSLNLAF